MSWCIKSVLDESIIKNHLSFRTLYDGKMGWEEEKRLISTYQLVKYVFPFIIKKHFTIINIFTPYTIFPLIKIFLYAHTHFYLSLVIRSYSTSSSKLFSLLLSHTSMISTSHVLYRFKCKLNLNP